VRAVRLVPALRVVPAARVGSALRLVAVARALVTARVVGGMLCLLLLAACSGSGTPDPSAGPSATDAAGTGGPAGPVQVTLGALPGAVGTPPVGGLGYHGFTISGPGGTVVAFRGAVAAPGEGERSFLADPGRTIERLLLETARPHVAGNELGEVERALAAP
jgi:hypothetical protein